MSPVSCRIKIGNLQLYPFYISTLICQNVCRIKIGNLQLYPFYISTLICQNVCRIKIGNLQLYPFYISTLICQNVCRIKIGNLQLYPFYISTLICQNVCCVCFKSSCSVFTEISSFLTFHRVVQMKMLHENFYKLRCAAKLRVVFNQHILLYMFLCFTSSQHCKLYKQEKSKQCF